LPCVGSGGEVLSGDTRRIFVQALHHVRRRRHQPATEDHRFDALKAAFAARGYDAKKLLDFSYAGGTFDAKGAWQPQPYPCEITDRRAADSVAVLEQTLRDYRSRHRGAHFALVGHSLGGYIAFSRAGGCRPPEASGWRSTSS
jgi:pimeloyl-ACP methyl ester carboxylesterase